MAREFLRGLRFKKTYVVHAALRQGLKTKLFRSDPRARDCAERLVKYLESDRSTYGRQSRMIKMMIKGATVNQMSKRLHCARRTVFRYLVELHQAHVAVTLEGNVYTVDKSVLMLVA